MDTHAGTTRLWLMGAAMAWAIVGFTPGANAQEAVLITCKDAAQCGYQRVFSATVAGRSSVKVAPVSAASDAQRLKKARTVRLTSLAGLYRDPSSGLLRVYAPNGVPGDVVVPEKLPRNVTTAASALNGATLEYREHPKSKTRAAVPVAEFVALLISPRPEAAVVDFLKGEVSGPARHPLEHQLVSGARSFAEDSSALRAWRDELKESMRRSLEVFRNGGVDPTRLEATLEGGLEALRVYRMVALEGEEEQVLQDDLIREHRLLLDRCAVASAFEKVGMYDAFLYKLEQLGLARWSRPQLVAKIGPSLRASGELHHERGKALFAAKQFGRAFDEGRLASVRAICDETVNEFYYLSRVEFVNQNTVLAAAQYEKEHKSFLEQIVRELHGIGQESTLTPERVEYVRKRIAEGERLDKDYLPLQLKKAEFLASVGELTASREVVTRVERTVQLTRATAEEWLRMDASLNGRLVTLRRQTERLMTEQMSNGEFREVLDTAAVALRAEPDNLRFLYLAAVAAAIVRDEEQTKRLIERRLRLLSADCSGATDVTETLLDLYRRSGRRASPNLNDGRIPNWMSGERYAPGEIFYDPVSGSFQPRVISSETIDDKAFVRTDFRWDGYMAASIVSSVGKFVGLTRPQLELEPVYDRDHVYMSGIGVKANSADARRTIKLRYRTSPDFDPVLAAQFTKKVTMRGWAGNPFFHPFLWNDIFVFDFVYDALGRLTQAVPVRPDASHPGSSFSEPLTFAWQGTRLLSIAGATYRRDLEYDDQGRLARERITHASGKGKIEYRYQGDGVQPSEATCEDDFYDKTRRLIVFDGRRR